MEFEAEWWKNQRDSDCETVKANEKIKLVMLIPCKSAVDKQILIYKYKLED